jgi:hypothetical protein
MYSPGCYKPFLDVSGRVPSSVNHLSVKPPDEAAEAWRYNVLLHHERNRNVDESIGPGEFSGRGRVEERAGVDASGCFCVTGQLGRSRDGL